MGLRRIKKYTIHILAVPAQKPGVFDLPPERNAVIICTGRTNSYIDNYIKKNKLVLNFPDYEDPRLVGSFNGAHAGAMRQCGIILIMFPTNSYTTVCVANMDCL